jgi:hypothetical protein
MWALIGNAETAFSGQCLKSFRYGSGLQHPDGVPPLLEMEKAFCR